MKRPIPEGVRPPKSTVVILGWGTEFNVPGRFMGWAMQPDAKAKEDRQWFWCEYDGIHHKWIYAADAGSEVARLNDPEIPESSPTTNPPQISNPVVDAIEAIRDLSTDRLSFALYTSTVRAMCKEAHKLAKGTE